jgi:two-component system chemotaxis response regulator CheY
VSHRILIVEDAAESRAQLADALRSVEGVEVVVTASGFEALRLLPRQRFDLIITDVRVPDMDGFELVNFVKKSPPYRTTPLVLVSESQQEEERLRGLSLGANAYLARPFEAADVKNVVRDQLAGQSPVATA